MSIDADTRMSDLFSMDNLAAFERHGAKIETRKGTHGCCVHLPNGWRLSIQWGGCMYGSNYDCRAGAGVPPAETAEIAASRGDGLVRWADGDTVQGWCSMERVQHILDLLAADKLMRAVDTPSLVADDLAARP